jgi:hypothetical protein
MNITNDECQSYLAQAQYGGTQHTVTVNLQTSTQTRYSSKLRQKMRQDREKIKDCDQRDGGSVDTDTL